MTRRWIDPLMIVTAFGASAFAWGRVPDRLPVHWDIAGDVDRWGSRFEGLLIMPAVMLFTWMLMRVLPAADPRRHNFAKMAGTYETVITLALASQLAIHLALVATALGHAVPIGRVVPLVVGVLLIGMGNVLPRARPNWWFGVRTPWTLSSDRVWTRTHRVAGYAMVAAGFAFILTAAVDAPWARGMLIACAGVAALFPIAYSYFAWRQETTSR